MSLESSRLLELRLRIKTFLIISWELDLKLMRRSIRNFNILPRAYSGQLTVHRARGGGNLNVALEGWEI